MTELETEGRHLIESLNVSRETIERLDSFAALLQKWNPAINLVSKASLAHLWSRHFYDSAQLWDLCDKSFDHWVDIGSGAGFPGMVVAIFAFGETPGKKFTLVESDARKAEFLRNVSRETNVPINVISKRIEEIPPLNADILSARALAPLTDLLGFAELHLKPGGRALFPKGASFRQELKLALETWAFESEEYPSKTDDEAVILSLGDIRRV